MHRKFIDFTGSSCAGGNIEMLKETISYDRCAQIVTNAFLNGLVKSGLPIDQAFNVFTSKAFRHVLDWRLEDNLERVACKALSKGGSNKDGVMVQSPSANRSFRRAASGALVSETSKRERKK